MSANLYRARIVWNPGQPGNAGWAEACVNVLQRTTPTPPQSRYKDSCLEGVSVLLAFDRGFKLH